MSEYYYNNSSGSLVVNIPLSDEKVEIGLLFYSEPATDYDLYDDTEKNSMFFDISTLAAIAIVNKRGSGNRIWLYSAQIFIVWGNNFITSNLLADIPFKEVKVTNNETIYHTFGVRNDSSLDNTENQMFWPGDCELLVRLQFRDKNDKKFVCWFKPKWFDLYNQNSFQMHVHRPTLESINIGATKKEFYINEEFSIDYGAIRAIYKYTVDGAFEEKVINNFTSNPSVGAKLKNPDTSKPIEQGFKQTVTISYGEKSQTYDISVKGVKSFTKPELPQYIKLGAYTGDLENTVFTYDDDTTTSAPTNVSALVTPGFVGYFDVSYNSYASKIKQYGRWGSAESTRFEDE